MILKQKASLSTDTSRLQLQDFRTWLVQERFLSRAFTKKALFHERGDVSIPVQVVKFIWEFSA